MAKRDVSGALFRAIGEQEALRDALRAARGKVARASARGGAKTKAKAARDAIQREYERASRRVDQLNKQLPAPRKRKPAAKTPAAKPAQKPAPARAPVPKKPSAKAPAAPAARGAAEWEVGVNYEGSRRAGNAVMVNFRITGKRGELVSPEQAQAAVKLLHRGGTVGDVASQLGLHVEGVNWQRPRWPRAKEGGARDLESFSAILQSTYMSDFRVSPVEPDE